MMSVPTRHVHGDGNVKRRGGGEQAVREVRRPSLQQVPSDGLPQTEPLLDAVVDRAIQLGAGFVAMPNRPGPSARPRLRRSHPASAISKS